MRLTKRDGGSKVTLLCQCHQREEGQVGRRVHQVQLVVFRGRGSF